MVEKKKECDNVGETMLECQTKDFCSRETQNLMLPDNPRNTEFDKVQNLTKVVRVINIKLYRKL